MPFDFVNNFQLQVYCVIMLCMISFTSLWIYILHQYFILLKQFDESLFTKLGKPNIKSFKFPKEMDLVRHLFSDTANSNQHLAKWHKRLRYVFLLYILFFVLICSYVIFSALV